MPPPKPPPARKCAPCLLALLVGALLLVVFSNGVATVVRKLSTGAGMAHCCSIEGVAFNYMGIFVLFCAIAVALLLGLVLRFREWRMRRDFERKYGVRLPAAKADYRNPDGACPGPSLHGAECDDGD